MQIEHAQIDDGVILLSAGKQSQIRVRHATTGGRETLFQSIQARL